MTNSEGIGRALEPQKFDLSKLNKSQANHPSNVNSSPIDKFGQQYDADSDNTKWSDQSPQDSRRYHSRSDVDNGPRSLHHTLGTRRNQASPGDHNHDGTTSKKLGPLEMDPANNGKTRAQWTIPTSPTVADLVGLLSKFVNFRQV